MMDIEEELERAIADRDMAESEAERLSYEMADIERENPDFEEDEEWLSLHDEVNALENEAHYLTSCIEDLKEQIADV